MRAVGEGGFGGEDVALQPFEQLLAMRGDPVDLWVMNVRIDEAGDDQAGQSLDGDVAGQRGGEGVVRSARDDDAVLDQHQSIGLVPHRVSAGLRRVQRHGQQFAPERAPALRGGHAQLPRYVE